MADQPDKLSFSNSGFQIPDAGVYSSPRSSKGPAASDELPEVGSRILHSPMVQNAYDSFGLEGLKSILLQELVRLEWASLQDELLHLAEGANDHKVLKRALRATKLMAAQWLEDHRQPPEVKEKCQYIFDSISTFGTLQVQAPDSLGAQMGESVQVLFPNTGPLEPVGAEEDHIVAQNSSLLFITDLQGHYYKLETLLLNLQLTEIQNNQLHWIAPTSMYLVVVGDLLSKSPFSTWGDDVGFDSYYLLKTLEYFMKAAPDNITISYGAYDLDIATKAAFYHPESGFMGKKLGVNAQAQSIPVVMSFVQGTAQGPTEQADFAWDYDESTQSYELKSRFQSHGVPYLTVPPNEEGMPDVQPIIDFYEALYQRLVNVPLQQRPATIDDIDAIAAELLPPTTEQLNLAVLKTSLGRCLHYEGLLEGTGTIAFLRERIAGMHVFQAHEIELFAVHPQIQEISLDMLHHLKPRELNEWKPPELETFLQQSKTLQSRQISPDRLIQLVQLCKFNRLNDWLALSEEAFYQHLKDNQFLGFWVPDIFPSKDQKGFCNAYRQLRWELINEDPSGLTGYAINMDGTPRQGEPVMRKVSELEERSRRSYMKTFLMDTFREELPFSISVQPEGVIAEYQNDFGHLTISLLIDESVAIYKDTKERLHMPVKHAAWIEYV